MAVIEARERMATSGHGNPVAPSRIARYLPRVPLLAKLDTAPGPARARDYKRPRPPGSR
jgi:hypothetical protein